MPAHCLRDQEGSHLDQLARFADAKEVVWPKETEVTEEMTVAEYLEKNAHGEFLITCDKLPASGKADEHCRVTDINCFLTCRGVEIDSDRVGCPVKVGSELLCSYGNVGEGGENANRTDFSEPMDLRPEGAEGDYFDSAFDLALKPLSSLGSIRAIYYLVSYKCENKDTLTKVAKALSGIVRVSGMENMPLVRLLEICNPHIEFYYPDDHRDKKIAGKMKQFKAGTMLYLSPAAVPDHVLLTTCS